MNKAVSLELCVSYQWLVSACLIYDKVRVLPETAGRTAIFAFRPKDQLANSQAIFDLLNDDGNDFIEVFYPQEVNTVRFLYYPLLPSVEARRAEVIKDLTNEGYDVYTSKPCLSESIHRGPGEIIHTSVQALLPVDTTHIGKAQIVDFRSANELRRFKFQNTAKELITSFGAASSEREIQHQTRLFTEAICDEQEAIRRLYHTFGIEAVNKSMAVSWTPVAFGAMAASMLHVSCFLPLALLSSVSLCAAQILNSKGRADQEVKQSPWSYLWEIKKLG